MRLTLLLLSALLLATTGCATRRMHHAHTCTHHGHHHRSGRTARAVIDLIGASIDLAVQIQAIKARDARQRRAIKARARAIEAQELAQAVQRVPDRSHAQRPQPTVTAARPLKLADRMGDQVILTLKDGSRVSGVLRGDTGVYVFVQDEAGRIHQIAATDIESHSDLGAVASAP